jgi:hypothetical protein
MANGTIAFDTLSTSGQITGTAKSLDTDYVVNGSAKAWERHNASHSIDSSLSVSSITDNGTGDTTVTYASALSAATQIIGGSAGNNDGNECVILSNSRAASTTTTHRYVVGDSGGTYRDRAVNASLVHGDLA